MIRSKYIVLSVLYFSSFVVSDQSKVVFSTILLRHGDRIPIDPYPADPWGNLTYWPAPGWGQLTDKGKRQHFELGKTLRQRYNHLLSDKYFPNEIYIRSTDYDRTIMSALSNLAGLYPTSKKNEWTPNINWQPIPIHVIPKVYDDVLMQSSCPRYNDELKKLSETEPFKEMDRKLAPLYKYLTLHTGRNVYTMTDISHIYDTLKIEELYNLTLPSWTKSVYPEQMEPVAVKCFFTDTYNNVLKRLKAGPLVKEITLNLKAAAKGNSSTNIIMYSAHDTIVANILNALNMYDGVPPSYASHIFFDLIIENNLPFVQVTYQDNVLTIPNCGLLCPLSKWIDMYNWLIPEDHTVDCMPEQQNVTKLVWEVSYGVATIFLAIVGVILILARRKKNNISDVLTVDENDKPAYTLMN